MIHEVARPAISPAFTIGDIRKIREWHYETLKDATVQERLDFYNKGAAPFQEYDAGRAHEGQAVTEPQMHDAHQ